MKASPAFVQALAEQWGRRVVSKVELTLPLAPTANKLFYNRTKKQLGIAKAIGKPLSGRGKTDLYRTWERVAGNVLNAARPRPGRIAGRYALTILISTEAPGDIGNREKALSDFLQSAGLVDNDRLADSIFIQRSEHVALRECLVTIKSIEREAKAA